jgi:glycosyltransferase 2 family protein
MGPARRVGGLLAGLLAAAFVVWGAAGGWSKAASYDWELDYSRLAPAVAVLVLFYLAWVAGYVALLECLAGRRLARRRFASIWARSLPGRYVPGNVLMVTGRVVLGREAGVSAQVSLAASVYEQVAMLVVAGLAATAFLLSDGSGWSPLFWSVLLVPLGLVLLDPAVIRRGMDRLLARLGRPPAQIALSRGQVAVLLGWFGLTMGLLAAGIGLAVRAVAGEQAPGVAFSGLGFLLAWVVSMLAFVFPSGLGVREGALAVVLARHMPAAAALSLAAASRLLLTAVELGVVAALAAAGRTQGSLAYAPLDSREAGSGL